MVTLCQTVACGCTTQKCNLNELKLLITKASDSWITGTRSLWCLTFVGPQYQTQLQVTLRTHKILRLILIFGKSVHPWLKQLKQQPRFGWAETRYWLWTCHATNTLNIQMYSRQDPLQSAPLSGFLLLNFTPPTPPPLQFQHVMVMKITSSNPVATPWTPTQKTLFPCTNYYLMLWRLRMADWHLKTLPVPRSKHTQSPLYKPVT